MYRSFDDDSDDDDNYDDDDSDDRRQFDDDDGDHQDLHDYYDIFQVFNCSAQRLASCIEAAGKGEIAVEGELETNILIVKVEKSRKGKRRKKGTRRRKKRKKGDN